MLIIETIDPPFIINPPLPFRYPPLLSVKLPSPSFNELVDPPQERGDGFDVYNKTSFGLKSLQKE